MDDESQCFQSPNWLTGTAISRCLEVMEHSGQRAGQPVLAASTWLLSHIENPSHGPTAVGDWFAGARALTQCERLAVPLHLFGSHWALLMLHLPRDDPTRSAFYVYDPLDRAGVAARGKVGVVCRWLAFEGENRRAPYIPYERLPVHVLRQGPQQTNSVDCGVYVLAMAFRFLIQPNVFARGRGLFAADGGRLRAWALSIYNMPVDEEQRRQWRHDSHRQRAQRRDRASSPQGGQPRRPLVANTHRHVRRLGARPGSRGGRPY